MKSKDKGPMFALLWKQHHQTKDKAKNSNGFRDLFPAGFFFVPFNNYDFACKVGDQNL